MFKPYTRYLVLLFMAGFMWGYVTKTIVASKLYIGWDDIQIIESQKFDIIDLDNLKTTPVDLSKDEKEIK